MDTNLNWSVPVFYSDWMNVDDIFPLLGDN